MNSYWIAQALAQKRLTEKRQTQLATIVSHKITRVTSHRFYYSMCSKCLSAVRMRAANVDTTRKQQAQQPAFHKVV